MIPVMIWSTYEIAAVIEILYFHAIALPMRALNTLGLQIDDLLELGEGESAPEKLLGIQVIGQ